MGHPFPVIELQSGGTRPTELMVFGERNSGTNLAHELLRRNIPAFADSPGDRIGKYGFRYGWKHGFPQMLAAPDNVLAICLFRHPESWLRSMHARPWHAAPALKDLSFEQFIRAEWQACVDEKNFGVDASDPRAMTELHWDRHPLTGARFANIVQLRNAKSAGFLSLLNRFANCLLLRFETLQGDQEEYVNHVARRYGLEKTETFQPVEERRGKPSDGPFKAQTHAILSPEDRAYVWSELDHLQEERLGYVPSSGPSGSAQRLQSR